MAREVRAGDWIALASEQARACRLKHGILVAPADGKIFPCTPGTFALTTFKFWNASVSPVFAAARAEGKFDSGPFEYDGAFVVDDIAGSAARKVGGFIVNLVTMERGGFFMSAHPRERAADTKSAAVKQACLRIDSALRTMLDAMSKGSTPGTRGLRGELCLDVINAARFWDSVTTLGREFSFLAAGTSVTVEEYWDVIVEGANDGLRGVGVAAGNVLNAVGEAAGSAASGFFEGLGVVETAVLVGGAVVVGKVL